MIAINNWDFRAELNEISPRHELAENTVCRLKRYLKVADQHCGNPRKIPRTRCYPNPLIDEQIWTFLVAHGYRKDPALLFEKLTGRKHTGPEKCKAWLEMLPMPARRGGNGKGSEGNSNIDLITGSVELRSGTTSGVRYCLNGPVCLLEAKWKSDIAGYTRHDPHRNQLARVIETAVTLQYHEAASEMKPKSPQSGTMPDEVYVTLLTPAAFKSDSPPWSRFYAYKFDEYSRNRNALRMDIERQSVPARQEDDWRYPSNAELEQRLRKLELRWVTYEELLAGIPDAAFKAVMVEFMKGQHKGSILDKSAFS